MAVKAMNKAELVEAVAKAMDMSKAATKRVIDATFGTIMDTLAKGTKVRLTDFGNFEVFRRKPRKGRVPATGKEIHIPAKDVPKFRPSKAMKEAVE